MEESRYLEFSCPNLEFSVNQGEAVQDSFIIYAGSEEAQGYLYSSDTRLQLMTPYFRGEESTIEYRFDAGAVAAGEDVRGQIDVISNQGEYTLEFQILVQKPVLQGSMGQVKNLFHFTNLAQSNWDEAVELFYSPEFIHIFHKGEKSIRSSYVGLSRFTGNPANVEEFFVDINKKPPLQYQTDIDSLFMEEVLDTTQKTITITRSGWGYTDLQVLTQGEFLSADRERITAGDFVTGACRLEAVIDAKKLHSGINIGKITICDTRTQIELPVTVTIRRRSEKHEEEKRVKRLTVAIVKNYIDMKSSRITKDAWVKQAQGYVDGLLEIDESHLAARLYQVQLLLARERFHEAKWYLDRLDEDILKEDVDVAAKCYYFYLTTLFNRDESYVRTVCGEIETARANHPEEWRLVWLLLYMGDDYTKSIETKWQMLEEQFTLGCISPVLLCEAALLLESRPTLLMKLEDFEQSVLWYAAKSGLLTGRVIEQLQYLAAREETYSPLLFRTLCAIYEKYKSPQTVAAVCRLLILGDKTGEEYFPWYELGVRLEVRVTKLYEYYMMSIPLSYEGELPKMVLMYFAYQSNLDYEHNAFLYAYIERNKERMPELEQSYRIAIERFVVDEIKLGHINENLAYLYQNILAPQMLRDETAYAFTPLLFMHRIYIENPKITSVVVLHDKINGESVYPVTNHICMLPIYGSEYTLLLQDGEGNRFTKSIPYENRQLMTPEKLLPFIGSYMEGRLSFDIYQCQLDRGYITITPENEKRFKSLSESGQVMEEFKKEIRTKLLHYYYDNDMIGELDEFLEETESEDMEAQERAEFIRFMISRGMFEKSYRWLRCFGLSGVNLKSVTRLISRRIAASEFQKEEFLVCVAFYLLEHTRYDENILNYLMLHYEGRISQLCLIWKTSQELELDTAFLMQRMLKQMRYTGAYMQEKDELLIAYCKVPEHDDKLAQECLLDTAYDYFVMDSVTDDAVLELMYERYRAFGDAKQPIRLALLKFWAENRRSCSPAVEETIRFFVDELLQKNIYFAFYQKLADIVPQLQGCLDKTFMEYRTKPGAQVRLHYLLDENEGEEGAEYESEDMQEMYGGIFVKMFSLFRGETLQYYITEMTDGREQLSESDILFGEDLPGAASDGRFFRINDILTSIDMQDEVTAEVLLEEYLEQDYITRQLFYVI